MIKKMAALYLYSDGWHVELSDGRDERLSECPRDATYHDAWAIAKVKFPNEVTR